MATISLLGTPTWTTTAGNKTVTATPAVDDLIVVAIGLSQTTDPGAPGLTDSQSGTYDEIAREWTASSDRQVSFHVRTALIPAASSTTFDMTHTGDSGGGLALFKVTGMSRVGSNAIRQFDGNSGAAVAMLCTIATAVLTENPVIMVGANGTNPAGMDPQTSPAYTESFADLGFATPASGLFAQHINSGETGTAIETPDASASAWSAMAVELDTSAAAAAASLLLPPSIQHLLVR